MKQFVLLLLMGVGVTHAQENDSLNFYYNTYQFQTLINKVEPIVNKTAKELFLMGKAYKQLGQFSDAEQVFVQAVKIDSINPIYLSQLADFLIKRKKGHLAFMHYQKLIQLQPENAYYYKKLGQAISSTNYSSIRDQLVLELNNGVYPESDDLKQQIVRQIFESNYLTDAISAYKKAIELNPKDIESRLVLSQIYLDKNMVGLADIFIQECVEEYPENKNFIMQAIKVAYRLKDYEDVIAKSRLFYSIADSNLLVQKLEGIAHFQINEYQEAIHLLENVMTVEKKNEVLSYYLGMAHQEIGDNTNAIKYLENAIDFGITENINSYYTQLAAVYEKQGNFEKSIQLYKAAYAKSKDKILLYHLARNYDEFYKDKTTALKYYELYFQENDTANETYFDYTKSRIHELKVSRHFDLDTLN